MRKLILCLLALTCFHHFSLAQTVSFVTQGSTWKYLDNGSNQGTAWKATSFNDASWSSGNAQLGYGDGDEAKVVSYGPSASNKYITTYFRKSFTAGPASSYSSLKLYLLRDDGAVVYLNGTEVARSNMPTGIITYTKKASTTVSGSAENTFYTFNLNTSLLINGTNVIAVEVHQSLTTGPDLSFDLKLEATAVAPVCAVPTGLSAGSITTASAMLSWAAVSGATGYNIHYKPSAGATWTTVSASLTNVAVSSLAPSTAYEWQVQTICSGSNSAYSASAFFTTGSVSQGTDTLVNTSSSWKYLDNGSNQGTAWRAAAFNDGSWASGNAELGYGDGGEATLVSYGPNASAKYITTYFRKSFNVQNPLAYLSLLCGYVRDDGIVIYLNGTEVFRNNMPSGTISYNTLSPAAIGGTDESAWNLTSLNTSALVAGNNVIAVEIHQQAGSSTDISFNLRLYASGVPALIRGPYLQKLSPTGITIRWRTAVPCDGKVNYGTTLSYGASITDPASTTEHSITLSGLNPATKYYYSTGTSQQLIQGDAENYFITSPVQGTVMPVRIWATGDFGNGSTKQDQVRDAYTNYTGTTPTNLWLWLGDNAYNTGTDAEFQNYVFNHYPAQFKKYPLYPSPGNHDYGNGGYQNVNTLGTNFPYFSIFNVPQAGEAGGVASGSPKYYSYNYANIHFISLDSYGAYNTTSSPMYTWLANDLAANTQRWIIAYWHHPPYTKGTHNSDTDAELINMRTNIVPLLESYHADLVLCGHSHMNERSLLIKGHYGTSGSFNATMKIGTGTNAFIKSNPYDGTVYAVCGTSGQNPGIVQNGYPMPCMAWGDDDNNCSMVIDINGDNLSAIYLTSTGAIADQFTITKTVSREPAADSRHDIKTFYKSDEGVISVDYYLGNSSQVKAELLGMTGICIMKFNEIPVQQEAGFYHFDLPLRQDQVQDGIYLFRLEENGKSIVKKIMIVRE